MVIAEVASLAEEKKSELAITACSGGPDAVPAWKELVGAGLSTEKDHEMLCYILKHTKSGLIRSEASILHRKLNDLLRPSRTKRQIAV